MLKFSVPPGYVRTKAPFRPKLDAFTGVIDAILACDKDRPKKQRHTSKRIFERLRDEHGFMGRPTIVKDYVAGWRRRTQEMFVPLVHPPGHAQADFGEAIGVIGGIECKIHFFAMDLPHSDAIFVAAYPAETTEAFCDGHVRAFTFFDGVARSVLYDNLWTPSAASKVICWRLAAWMHESIRPVGGAIMLLALMGSATSDLITPAASKALSYIRFRSCGPCRCTINVYLALIAAPAAILRPPSIQTAA
jgi:hypothetical protein